MNKFVEFVVSSWKRVKEDHQQGDVVLEQERLEEKKQDFPVQTYAPPVQAILDSFDEERRWEWEMDEEQSDCSGLAYLYKDPKTLKTMLVKSCFGDHNARIDGFSYEERCVIGEKAAKHRWDVERRLAAEKAAATRQEWLEAFPTQGETND